MKGLGQFIPPDVAAKVSQTQWNELVDWYVYAGIQKPPTVYPASLLDTSTRSWSVEEALAQSWSDYLGANQEFFESQFQRNLYTTPSITPDNLMKSMANNWKEILIALGVGAAGLYVVGKVLLR